MMSRKHQTRGSAPSSTSHSAFASIMKQTNELEALKSVGEIVHTVADQFAVNDKGISFLEAKNHMMVDYLSNLLVLLMTKLEGKDTVDSAVVDRLVFLQVLMEKIKPIDKKLRYQVDKVVKMAIGGGEGEDEDSDLSLKPNPARLKPKAGGVVEQETSDSATGVYQPPKMAAMRYTDEDPASIRAAKKQEREHKHMLNSSLMKELAAQVSDRPEELSEMDASSIAHLKAGREAKKSREYQEYEESNFVRLNRGKKSKKKSNPKSALHDIADFSGYKGYNAAAEELFTSVKRASMREKMTQAKRPKMKKRVLKKSKK
eukprot:m.14687 g.14687  ORF g.14687 m.14687 type:complete len:316 (+) comp7744_c0_seq1:78-1025(+)